MELGFARRASLRVSIARERPCASMTLPSASRRSLSSTYFIDAADG